MSLEFETNLECLRFIIVDAELLNVENIEKYTFKIIDDNTDFMYRYTKLIFLNFSLLFSWSL